MKKNKLVFIILILITLTGIVIVSVLSSKHPTGIAVDVTTVPHDSKIVANGKNIHNGTVYLQPGKYTVEISKKGFKTIQSTKLISDDNNYIQEALSPISEDAKNWAERNIYQYSKFESIVGATAQKTGEKFYKKYPLAKLLPQDKLVYKIGYSENADSSITINIYAVTPDQRAAAVQQIRDWGYDPVDYKIKFIDFINPLEQR